LPFKVFAAALTNFKVNRMKDSHQESFEIIDTPNSSDRSINYICICSALIIKLSTSACIAALYLLDLEGSCGDRVESALSGGLVLMLVDVVLSTITAVLKAWPQGVLSAYYLIAYSMVYWCLRVCYVAIMIFLNAGAFVDDCDLGDGIAGSLVLVYMIVLDLFVATYFVMMSCALCSCGMAFLGLLDTRRRLRPDEHT
jgi:hypothetical protein